MQDDHSRDTFVSSKGYFKVFSLQAGTCITSTVGVALMVSVFIYNIFAENRFATLAMALVQYFFIYSYAILMLVGFLFVSFASFLSNSRRLAIGFWLNLSGFVYWFILCIIGYIPSEDAFAYVCIDNRCPETHWMYETRWRNYGFRCPFGGGPTAEPTDYYDTGPDGERPMKATYAGCENYAGLPIAASTILGIIWALFLSYGLYTIDAYWNELEEIE